LNPLKALSLQMYFLRHRYEPNGFIALSQDQRRL